MQSLQMGFTVLFVLPVVAGLVGPASAQSGSEPDYVPCNLGPQALNQIDGWERDGKQADIKYQGHPVSPEALAETLIADCSARLSGLRSERAAPL
jgi:hypothetical protein